MILQRTAIVAVSLLLATGAFAQPQPPPDPVFLARALSALQAQRNAALDAQVVAEARAAMLADDVAQLKAKLDEMTKKAEPAK